MLRWNRAIGLDDHWFALGDDVCDRLLGAVLLQRLLAVAVQMTPVGHEGTLYAGIMSVFNLSSIVSNFIGAYMTSELGVTQHNFKHMWLLTLLCTLSSLATLPLLPLVPRMRDDTVQVKNKTNTA